MKDAYETRRKCKNDRSAQIEERAAKESAAKLFNADRSRRVLRAWRSWKASTSSQRRPAVPFPSPFSRVFLRVHARNQPLFMYNALWERGSKREREKKKGIELIFREILIDIFVGIKYIIFRETKRSSRERDSKVFFNRICFERKKENVRDKKILLLFFKGEFREGKKKKIIFISFRYRNNSSRMY